MNITDLAVRDVSLPDLYDYFYSQLPDDPQAMKDVYDRVDAERRAHEAFLKKVKTMKIAKPLYDLAVKRGISAGIKFLASLSKMGDILKDRPHSGLIATGEITDRKEDGTARNGSIIERLQVPSLKDLGITPSLSGHAHKIYDHPDEVAEIIEMAIRDEDMPSKWAVFKLIQMNTPGINEGTPDINKMCFTICVQYEGLNVKLEKIVEFKEQLSNLNTQRLIGIRNKINKVLGELE